MPLALPPNIVQSVAGSVVDNSDPANPVISAVDNVGVVAPTWLADAALRSPGERWIFQGIVYLCISINTNQFVTPDSDPSNYTPIGNAVEKFGAAAAAISAMLADAGTLAAILTAAGITPITNATYKTGLGVSSDGDITTESGIVTAATQAAP